MFFFFCVLVILLKTRTLSCITLLYACMVRRVVHMSRIIYLLRVFYTIPPPPCLSRHHPQVEEADVSGSLEGSLESTEKVSIRSTGLVSGTVIYKKMVGLRRVSWWLLLAMLAMLVMLNVVTDGSRRRGGVVVAVRL